MRRMIDQLAARVGNELNVDALCSNIRIQRNTTETAHGCGKSWNENCSQVIDVDTCGAAYEQITDGGEGTIAVVGLQSGVTVYLSCLEALHTGAICEGAGVVSRSVYAIGISREREHIETINGESKRQCELAVASAFSASCSESHSRLAAGEQHAGAIERAVLHRDLARDGRVHATNIPCLAFHAIGQDDSRDS